MTRHARATGPRPSAVHRPGPSPRAITHQGGPSGGPGIAGSETQDGFAAHLAEAGAEGAETNLRPGGIDTQVFAGALAHLQRTMGNGAVAGLMAGRTAQTRTTGTPSPVAVAIPADGAPAGSAVQRQAADPWGGGTVADRDVDPVARARQLVTAIKIEGLPSPRFSIPREATVAALTGLTADDGRALAAEFERRTNWNLRWLISGEIELDGWKPGNNLAGPVRKELLNLLSGTVAPAASAPTLEATGTMLAEAFTSVASMAGKGAEARQIREAVAGSVGDKLIADAGRHDEAALAKAGAHQVATEAAQLRDALKKRAVDEALELLRRPKEARDALDAAYRTHYGQPLIVAVTTLLSGNDMMRAIALLNGDEILADRLALEGEVAKRDKAEAEAALLDRFAPGSATDRRRQARGKVEARLEGIARTGHLDEVLGPDGVKGELAAKAGADKDAVAAAIVEGKAPELIGARLARRDAEGSIKPADVEDSIRRLTAKADSAGRRLILRNRTLAPQAEALASVVREGYFARFEAAFDENKTRRTLKQVLAGQPASFNDLMSSGGMEDVDLERNRALFEQRGKMDEWQVVYYALKREPKDIDRVREILDAKTEAGVVALAGAYAMHLAGRSLEQDLLGTALEQRGLEMLKAEAREGNAEKRELLQGGQFEADPRDEESVSLKKEGDWLFGRIAGLERRVMENRGLFAEVRDWVGNIEQELVALERGEAATAKEAFDRAFASTPADLNAARTQVSELRRINRRLKHAVKIYKEATKAAFEAFVDFAVEIAATIATAGQGGIILQAIRATAARIGTKMILKGDDYSAAEFLADLQDGLAGAGSAKIMKHTYAPLAKELADWAGKKGWSSTLAGKVAAQIAAPAAEEFVESGISNKLQGKDFTEGQSVEGAIKGVAKGHAVKGVKAGLDARRGMQLGPAGRGDAGEQGESDPRATHEPVTDMELGPAGRPREQGVTDPGATHEPVTDMELGPAGRAEALKATGVETAGTPVGTRGEGEQAREPLAPSIPTGATYGEQPPGRFVELGTVGAGTSNPLIVQDTRTGKKYVFKPADRERAVPHAQDEGIRKGEYAPRAKAAEIAARELGIATPHVELVTIDGKPGSLTEWVERRSLADLEHDPTVDFQALVKTPEFKDALDTIHTLDYLINQVDRVQNLGNYLVELTPDGAFKSLMPIDSELAFGSRLERADFEGYTHGLPGTVSPEMAATLERLQADPAAFIAEILPLVGDAAIPGVLHRLDRLADRARAIERHREAKGPAK